MSEMLLHSGYPALFLLSFAASTLFLTGKLVRYAAVG
jgi:membrane protein YqaA with SNARE-associated domain